MTTGNEHTFTLIGKGIYSVPEAFRLTGVAPRTIRRWLLGYAFVTDGTRHLSPAVVPGDFGLIDGAAALSFLDLLEVRVVNAFRDEGVSWKDIRTTHEAACELLKHRHPFSTGRFHTDGRSIVLESARIAGAQGLLNVAERQLEFKRVVKPFLKNLDFADDIATRWWPLGRNKSVVLDPARNFGQAIVNRESVPTSVLATAARTTSRSRVARWYEVSLKSVRDAVEFEEQLAA
jgi:hypothetical protein